MPVIFKESILHDRTRLMPGVSLAFEDPDAEAYFVAAGWADATKAKPVHTYSQEEIAVDPTTTYGDGPKKGQLVITGAEANG